jgi:hypothetical protein
MINGDDRYPSRYTIYRLPWKCVETNRQPSTVANNKTHTAHSTHHTTHSRILHLKKIETKIDSSIPPNRRSNPIQSNNLYKSPFRLLELRQVINTHLSFLETSTQGRNGHKERFLKNRLISLLSPFIVLLLGRLHFHNE